jgi:hypothetical protein
MGSKKFELSAGQKHAAFCYLTDHIDNNSKTGLECGVLARCAKNFNVDRTTMSKFWREQCRMMNEDGKTVNEARGDFTWFQTKQKERGRKAKFDRKDLRKKVRRLTFKERKNFRSMAVATGVPIATLHRMLKKEKVFRRHSSALKPILTEENKVSRVMFCLEEAMPVVADDGSVYYKNLFDRVDVDEKWFYLTQDNENYIICDSDYDESDSETESEEEDEDGEQQQQRSKPVRRIRHKKYITKVQFLCAQARPRWDPHRNAYWDGKVGIWPIGDFQPAPRRSVNREAGTLVWKDSPVTRDYYRKLLLEKVVPAIQEKWPRGEWNNAGVVIRIQQDGPQSHIKEDDEQFLQGLRENGLENKILIYTQPSNSPDLNINDLGFFRALQSMYATFSPRTASDIIEYVKRSYDDYPGNKINRIWLTLMGCMNKIIDCGGDNDYEIPHMGKERLERMGQLPITIAVTNKAKEYLGLG